MDLSDKSEYLTPNIKILLDDIEVKVDDERSFMIPKYIAWNGVSLPTPLLFLVNGNRFGSKVEYPSLVHDYLYDRSAPNVIERKDADDLFYKLLLDEGNSKSYSIFAWLTVRLLGTLDWRKESWHLEGYEAIKNTVKVEKIPDDGISTLDTYFYVLIGILFVFFVIFFVIMLF